MSIVWNLHELQGSFCTREMYHGTHKVAHISVWKSLPVIVADFVKRAWQGTLIFANCPVTLSSSVSLRCQVDPLHRDMFLRQ